MNRQPTIPTRIAFACLLAWSSSFGLGGCAEDSNPTVVCSPSTCVDGTCGTDRDGSNACLCNAGHYGPTCQLTTATSCADRPCGLHGDCADSTGGPVCTCDPEWQGVECRDDVNECAQPGICGSGASCVNSIGSYQCDCPVATTMQTDGSCRPDYCAPLATASQTFHVDVIGGEPWPGLEAPAALAGAKVRLEHPCTVPVDGTTNASGSVDLTAVGPSGGWTITVASAGYGATSVRDLDVSPVGAIRIDRLTSNRVFSAAGISGNITGVAAGDTVRVDGYDFYTVDGAFSSYSTQFEYSVGSPPLFVVGLEFSGGHLVNFAKSATLDPRPNVASTLSLAFGAPRAPIATRIDVTGVPGTAQSAVQGNVLQYAGPVDSAYVYAGNVAPATMGSGTLGFDVESYPDLVPSASFTYVDLSVGGRLIVITHVFDGVTQNVALPAGLGVPAFASSSPAGATAPSVAGASTLVMNLGETANQVARWRVYCSPTAHATTPCSVPSLPSGISASDIGLSQGQVVSAIALVQRFADGSPWSSRTINAPSAHLDWQLGGAYTNVVPVP